MTSHPIYAIIVAGGAGRRMHSDIPKQFIPVAGQPLMMHTINAFYNYSDKIKLIVVIHPDFTDLWNELCRKSDFNIPHKVVPGGKERFDSVKNGLNAINKEDGLVAVHDAVRPFVSTELINAAFDNAAIHGASVPVIAINDTLREIISDESRIIDRSNLFLVQTPQVFSVRMLKKAYQQQYDERFTDDAAVIESLGEKVHYFPGERNNLKITWPEDVVLAEAVMKASKQRNIKT